MAAQILFILRLRIERNYASMVAAIGIHQKYEDIYLETEYQLLWLFCSLSLSPVVALHSESHLVCSVLVVSLRRTNERLQWPITKGFALIYA